MDGAPLWAFTLYTHEARPVSFSLIPIFVSRFFLYLHGLGTHDTDSSLPTISAMSLSFPRGDYMYLAEPE